MKKLFTKTILASFLFILVVSLQAAITNVYEWTAGSDLAGLSIQPQANDLAQLSGSTYHIMKGGMHDSGFSLEALFNSDVEGSYGPAVNGQKAGIFIDELSPANDTIIHCDFDSPQTVNEVHVFTQWGDRRLFSWFEVWVSTTGTNDVDYSYLGTATFGAIGDEWAQYANSNCVARLYDPVSNILATNVISVKLVQKNCGYDTIKLPPGTNLAVNIDSCACVELDIIGPTEPTTITNVYYSNADLASLPIQPLSDDLAQGTDATNIIVAGGMHTWSGFKSNKFEFLFNSPSDGDLGVGEPLTVGGTQVLLTDVAIPSTLTMEMDCNFTTTKMVEAVHVFSLAGDPRLFTYGEVYSSANGVDYKYIGAVSFEDWGANVGPYSNKYCVASLYDSDTNKYLAENIISLKIKFLGVIDTTWANLTSKVFNASGGSAISEIDIVGKDGNIPPPEPPGPTTIYVGTEGTSNGSNYFTVIQEAVDAAVPGNLVLVSNGVYNTGGAAGEDGASPATNRVLCAKAIEIRSVDGPASTFIVGAPDAGTGENGPGAIRCVCFPWNSGATLSGFTLTNGYTLTTGDANRERGGGGARVRLGGLITNCIVVGNSGNGFGGGINLQWGTVADCEVYNNYSDSHAGGIFSQGGSIYNSTINNNESSLNGGGVWFYSATGEGGSMSNSVISGNVASEKGGGVYLLGNPTNPDDIAAKIYDCTVSSNSAGVWGGGINIEFGGEVHRAKVTYNETQSQSGGGIYLYRAGKIYDSLIYKNQSMLHGGGIFFDNVNDAALNGGEVYNCTIAANVTVESGGGINMANSLSNYFGLIVNSIIYTNIAFGSEPNWAKGPNGSSPFNCSIGPIGGLGGAGNITNDPEFVDIDAGNFHLLSTSPCINAGTNGAVTSTFDLDGNPRIEEGTVDMGCYESIPEPFSLLFIISCLLMFLGVRK